MPCSFSRVRMRECEVSPVKAYNSTKWPIHRRQVFNSSLACFWYIHREKWLHTSIWQMTTHSVSDHLPHFSKRMREKRELSSWCSSTDMLTNCKPTDKWAERWVIINHNNLRISWNLLSYMLRLTYKRYIYLLPSNTTTLINIPITGCRYITYVKTTCFGRHAAIIRSIQS